MSVDKYLKAKKECDAIGERLEKFAKAARAVGEKLEKGGTQLPFVDYPKNEIDATLPGRPFGISINDWLEMSELLDLINQKVKSSEAVAAAWSLISPDDQKYVTPPNGLVRK